MTTEAASEIGKAVYSYGLLAMGAIMILGAPIILSVLRDLTAALLAAAKSLHETAVDRTTLDQIKAKIDELEQMMQADRAAMAAERAALAAEREALAAERAALAAVRAGLPA